MMDAINLKYRSAIRYEIYVRHKYLYLCHEEQAQ